MNFLARHKSLIAAALLPQLILVMVALPISRPAPASAAVLELEQFTKDNILDQIARIIVNTIVATFYNSFLKWIQSGFQGPPAFVKDFQKTIIRQSAAQGAALFRTNLAATGLCPPFGTGRGGQVSDPTGTVRAYIDLKCTIANAATRLPQFFQSFQQGGGWNTWDQVLSPNNNAFGMYALMLDFKSAEKSNKVQENRDKYAAGQGSLGIRTCGVQQNVNLNATPAQGIQQGVGAVAQCLHYQDKTPGGIVSAQVNQVLKGNKELNAYADELSELISALVTSLLNRLLHTNFQCLVCGTSSTSRGAGFVGCSLLNQTQCPQNVNCTWTGSACVGA